MIGQALTHRKRNTLSCKHYLNIATCDEDAYYDSSSSTDLSDDEEYGTRPYLFEPEDSDSDADTNETDSHESDQAQPTNVHVQTTQTG